VLHFMEAWLHQNHKLTSLDTTEKTHLTSPLFQLVQVLLMLGLTMMIWW
jgi:hypothetical protein